MSKFNAKNIATAATLTIACFAGSGFSIDLRDAELKGRTLCVAPNSISVSVDQPLGLNVEALKSRIGTELLRRLTLSRVTFSERTSCTTSDIRVSVNTTSALGTTRAWAVGARLTDWFVPNYLNVIFWDTDSFGLVNRAGASLEDYLFEQARDAIEALTAAWIRVNP